MPKKKTDEKKKSSFSALCYCHCTPGAYELRKCVPDPVLLFVIVENCKVDSGVELIAFLKVCHDTF